jgi:transglutaminase-like putative cysteine protease
VKLRYKNLRTFVTRGGLKLNRSRFLALSCLAVLCGSIGVAQQRSIFDQASRLELAGDFKQAAVLLSGALTAKALSEAERKQLEVELDRLTRIRKDFPFTQSELFAELKKSVKGLTAVEFEQWVLESRFDSRQIDGQRRFMVSSVSNLFFRYPELNPRRIPPKDNTMLDRQHREVCLAIQDAARRTRQPYVLPKRFHVRMQVKANAAAAPDQELIRAWLPIPRQYPFQTGFELTSASTPIKHIDDPLSPIRSVYLETPAHKGKPTEFNIEYEYTGYGVWFELKPQSIQATPDEAILKQYTQEAPHVVFTPEIRSLAQEIAGVESNPCLKAKKFYDWIAEHIQYSFAVEYSTIRNISDDCRTKRYGDCGQEALLFITLCRLNGIPARWQSGWNTFPGAKFIHDWCEIYLAPYGWVPVDPYMGIYAMRYATTLSWEQRRQIRDFYFGGLDQYRVIANSDHNQTLSPPKQSLRSDDVDFQRGELEWGNHNIYFDQYSYDLTVKELEKPHKSLE